MPCTNVCDENRETATDGVDPVFEPSAATKEACLASKRQPCRGARSRAQNGGQPMHTTRSSGILVVGMLLVAQLARPVSAAASAPRERISGIMAAARVVCRVPALEW